MTKKEEFDKLCSDLSIASRKYHETARQVEPMRHENDPTITEQRCKIILKDFTSMVKIYAKIIKHSYRPVAEQKEPGLAELFTKVKEICLSICEKIESFRVAQLSKKFGDINIPLKKHERCN
jgi:hypothetical protein